MIRTSNRVALYARFSSDNQRTESIDAQLRAMRGYCEQHNYDIVETYVDEAKSATTDRRPAFQRMINDSSTHSFNILLVHKLDRFARNRYDSAVYKRELKKNGVVVYSVLENLDDSPESIMMEAVLEGMSEYYSQNLAREVMKGLQENALQGKHTGGKPALGYDVDPVTKKLVINEGEAEAVRVIFDMYGNGHGYTEIIDTLHHMGFKTKFGNDFKKNSLYGILTNPKYQGIYTYNRSSAKDSEGRRNSHLYKDEEEIISIEDGCPQIIDRALYAKVQALMSEHKHTGGRGNAKERYLLSGKVYCADCGHAMVGNHRRCGRSKLPYITYRCPSRRYNCSNKEISRDYLETFVVELIEREILNANALYKIRRAIEKQARTVQKPAESQLEQEKRDIDNAIQNVADAIENGLISEALVERLKVLERRKAELAKMSSRGNGYPKSTTVDPAVILDEYVKVKHSPASPQYKEFLRGFVERIEMGKYTATITLKTGLDIFPELDKIFEVRRQEIYGRQKLV